MSPLIGLGRDPRFPTVSAGPDLRPYILVERGAAKSTSSIFIFEIFEIYLGTATFLTLSAGAYRCNRSQRWRDSRLENDVHCGYRPKKDCCIEIDVYTSITDMKRPAPSKLPCMCGSFRQTSRALTRLYESALRPLGLRVTQFTILQALSLAGEVTQNRLGEILGTNSTTLTRTLRIMVREGWIAERRAQDRRERRLLLAKGGQTLFNRALPIWEKVQSRLRHQLGKQAWENLLEITHQVTELLTT